MPTTVAEVLDDLKDGEAVSKLSGLVTAVHADRLKPAQRSGRNGLFWGAFLPVSIRADNRVVDAIIYWPVSKDGVLEAPADLIRGGMELKILSGKVLGGKAKPPDAGGGFWSNSVACDLANVRLDGAETPPQATNAGRAVSPPASGEIGAPAASQTQSSAQARPSMPPKSQAAAVGFMVSAWDSLSASLASTGTQPESADLAHMVGVLTQAYLQGRIE